MEKLALSLEQAAEVIGVSEPTMLTIANQPGFPALKVGRRWIIPVQALAEWLNEQANNQARY